MMRRVTWIIGVVAGVVALGGAAWAYQNRRSDVEWLWEKATSLVHHSEAAPEEQAQPEAPAGDVEMTPEGYAIVSLASPEVAVRIGLTAEAAVARTHADTIVGNAEIAYNANEYGEVRPRVPGIIREVIADEGVPLRPGQPMLTIDSAAVGTAKADYLAALPIERLAQQTLDMTLALRKDNAAPLKDELMTRADLNKARAAVLDAKQRLTNLGLTESDLARIATQQDTSTVLEVTSPIQGVVVDRHCVSGEAVQPTDRVFVVADTTMMWAWIDIYESDIERVEIGQPVEFLISGTTSPIFQGKVDWIDAAINAATRTIRVRAVLKNQGDRLRAFEFGQASIRVGEEHQAVFVPRDAVQTVGDARLVFIQAGPNRYVPRVVTVKEAADRGEMEVTSGLEAGEPVVSTGAFLLKSQMLKLADPPAA